MESVPSSDDDNKKTNAPNPEAYVYGSGAAFRPVERLPEPNRERPRIIAPLSGIGEVVEIPLRPAPAAQASQEQQRQQETDLDDDETDTEDDADTRRRVVASRIFDPIAQREAPTPSAETTPDSPKAAEDAAEEVVPPLSAAMPQPTAAPERPTPQGEHVQPAPVSLTTFEQPLPAIAAEERPRAAQEQVWTYPVAVEASNERPVSDPSVPHQPIGSGVGIRPLAPSEYVPLTFDEARPASTEPEPLPSIRSWEDTPPATSVEPAEQPHFYADYAARTAPHNYDQYGGGSAEYVVPATASTSVERVPQPTPNTNLAPLVGLGLVGEFFARRRLRREVRANQKQNQEAFTSLQKEANATQQRYGEQQRQFTQEQQRHADEMQRVRQIQERFNVQPLSYPERSVTPQPQVFEAPQPRPVEQALPPIAMPEQSAAATAEQHVAAITDRSELKPGEHKVMDAWRTAIVKNGREVEGAITYGQGYHQERRAEIIPDTTSDTPATAASNQGNGTQHRPPQSPHTGSGAYVGGFGGYTMPTYSSDSAMAPQPQGVPGLPSGMTTPSLPQGQPTHGDPQHQLPPVTPEPQSNLTNPWFWLMLGLIAAAFFTATLI